MIHRHIVRMMPTCLLRPAVGVASGPLICFGILMKAYGIIVHVCRTSLQRPMNQIWARAEDYVKLSFACV